MENTWRNGKKRMCFRTDVDLSLLALMCSKGAPLQNDFFVEFVIGKVWSMGNASYYQG